MLSTEEVVNRLNHIANLTDKLRADILNSEVGKKKQSKAKNSYKLKDIKVDLETNKQETVSSYDLGQLLIKYDLPIDKQFLEDIDKLARNNRIDTRELESCFKRVQAANQKSPKDDIKNYVFKCLNNINK